MDGNFKKYEQDAELLKVLAHPVRLCIVNGLLNKGKCNVSKIQECLQIPQSTVSQHLQKLKAAGIIAGQRNGLEVSYIVSNERVKEVVKALENI